jgi:hAT family C-terminal dimerisation region
MALDILSIPAMSTELERIFSSCEHLLSDRKSRTGDDLIEAIECLRSWWGQDLINFGGDEV